MINLGEDLDKCCRDDLYTTVTLTTNLPVQKETDEMEFTTNKEQEYYLLLKKKYRNELGREKLCGFLNLQLATGEILIDNSSEGFSFQTSFTLKELKKLHPDLSKFKMIKAEDLPDEY